MEDDANDLRRRVEELERKVAVIQSSGPHSPRRPVRRRSTTALFGLPLYDIALGPDLARNEPRGHAKGILAIGDVATGVIALGGLARGVFALGGLAIGIVSFGGCSLGLALALGGLAVGGIAAGGGAVGFIAAGGAAVGYYAFGGGAFGCYVLGPMEQSPEARELLDAFRRSCEGFFER